MLLLTLAQVIAPAALLCWLWSGRTAGRAGAVLLVIGTGAWLSTIASAGLWLAIPRPLLWLWAVGLGACVVRAAIRWRGVGAAREPRRPGLALIAPMGVFLFASAALVSGLQGRRMPAGTIDLAVPLDTGTFVVVNGGATELLNAHFRTLANDARRRRYRGQSYGVDIVALNRWRVRARGFQPGDPAAYAAFGRTVLAPCGGVVVRAEDGHRDLSPPETDRDAMAGNHVIIACDPYWVVLGHLRNGSVRVVAGDSIARGTALGQIGNSGNTSEPHLHMHAQTPGSADAPLSGEPIHVTLGGRFVARNAVLRR